MKFSKSYIFVGTLATAGLIVGVTYNLIQANNRNVVEESPKIEVSQVSTNLETYDDLQNQINSLRADLEDTKTDLNNTKTNLQNTKAELENTKYQLSKSNTNVNSLKSKLNSINTSYKTEDNSRAEEISKKIDNIELKDNVQKELVKQKEELEIKAQEYKDRICSTSDLKAEQIKLNSKKVSINNQIYNLTALGFNPDTKFDGYDKMIQDMINKANESVKTSEKEYYLKKVEEFKKQKEEAINKYNKNLEKWNNLNKQLKEIEDEISQKDFDNKIADIELSEDENTDYNEICSKIEELNKELLKY